MTTNTQFPGRTLSNGATSSPILTRSLLKAGGIEAIMTRDSPSLRLSTDDERASSLHSILSTRPAGDVWIFAYGSLIWNPAVRVVERRTARIQGWHRAFCLSMTAGRGSPENPGLVLALEAGGECVGTAYRLADHDVEVELPLLWKREMLCGGYVPKWVAVKDEDGVAFGSAIAFTIDSASDQYTGELPMQTIVRRLATAHGGLGSSADYLFRTRDGLRDHGIEDMDLERIAICVETELEHRQAARGRSASSRSNPRKHGFQLA